MLSIRRFDRWRNCNPRPAQVFALAKIEGFGVAQLPWHNFDNPVNVDADPEGHVVAADALMVIDELNFRGSYRVPASDAHVAVARYLDVNGDGFVSAPMP